MKKIFAAQFFKVRENICILFPTTPHIWGVVLKKIRFYIRNKYSVKVFESPFFINDSLRLDNLKESEIFKLS